MDKQLKKIRNWLLFGVIGLAILFLAVFVFVINTVEVKTSESTVEPTSGYANTKTEPKRNTAGQETEPEPEHQFTAPEIEMVFVEGGTFTMGNIEVIEESISKSSFHYRSKPAHKVTVSSFYIGKYEITQGQ